ncbi:hypothetical protein [Paenirhodobacter populi]|uniref:DeoR C-terminal sensor domain-containing protein n=1 Tax=Paenirhodobacter populi TaxID=2306993 RepID=A0A443JKJ8_9RHOB|nr:hypothetical protein [Sinirhodobacter populi]RWR21044.1 hypothetical protein D2T30_09330 [Sinirhodobacter populi]
MDSTDDLLRMVRAAEPELTPKLRGICRLIETDPVMFLRSAAGKLCTHTSEPTLIRFCQRSGYAGLADFRMMDAADRVILLADSAGFGKPRLHRIRAMEHVSVLVTDLPSDHETACRIRDRGVQVVSTIEEPAL